MSIDSEKALYILILLLVTTRLSYLIYNLENNINIIPESGSVVLSFYSFKDNIL